LIEATLIALDDKMTQSEKNRDQVIQSYTIYKDYPQKGVDFQDVFSVFSNGIMNAKLMDLLVARFRYAQLDYVIGLESRGFCLGYALAYELTKLTGKSVGFLPVRKEDAKLPGQDIIRVKYTKEYGTDSFKMVNISQKGKRVVVLDDLIGLGGSMWAGLQLALMQEFDVVDCCALRQVDSLQTQALKQIGRSYTILLQGDGKINN
jgi:adenine phosphoribosyltransferase